MGSCYALAASDLRDRLYADREFRNGITIIDDDLFDDKGTHLLKVVHPDLPFGRNGMRAIVDRGGRAYFQDDRDT